MRCLTVQLYLVCIYVPLSISQYQSVLINIMTKVLSDLHSLHTQSYNRTNPLQSSLMKCQVWNPCNWWFAAQNYHPRKKWWNCNPVHTTHPNDYVHWKRDTILMKFLSQAGREVVKMTPSSAANDEIFNKMTFLFQCTWFLPCCAFWCQ